MELESVNAVLSAKLPGYLPKGPNYLGINNFRGLSLRSDTMINNFEARFFCFFLFCGVNE